MHFSDKITRFENDYDLSRFVLDEIWYYPILKNLVIQKVTNASKPEPKGRKNTNDINVFKQLFQDLRWKFKSKIPDNITILFADNATTRRNTEHGKFENIYLAQLQKSFTNQLLLEYPSPVFGHYNAAADKAIYYPDWEVFKILVHARFKKRLDLDEQAIREFYTYLNQTPDFHSINDRINKFILYQAFFKRFLKKIKPQVVVLIDSYNYNQMALIYTAKKLGIPTIELQHGLISESHAAYMYQRIINFSMFPDYMFTFGRFFTDIMKKRSKMFYRENVKTCGYPYLEFVNNKAVNLPEKLLLKITGRRIIYITSQWTIRTQLWNFVLLLSKHLKDEYLIIYKPHPGERQINSFYVDFKQAKNIFLISDYSLSSVEIMKVADVHSTVYSTSYFESVFFKLPNIFFDVPGYSQNIYRFIDGKTSFLAKNVQDYLTHLDKIQKETSLTDHLRSKAQSFYELNALEKVQNALYSIIEDRHTLQ